MNQTITMFFLGVSVLVGLAFANFLIIDVMPQKGGVWGVVEVNDIPQAAMDVVVTQELAGKGMHSKVMTTIKSSGVKMMDC
ncbi:hypothetical protein C9J48_13545 [Photobacterium profundum]|uniref:Uncharacterized protein n=1 Tax=Photobacterium profundum 3TCK TaxID=314280 RepID=Q1Z3G5_9GAMM|nr:hypothetical protein [Photobacterium profundum]EAS43041.1 hypothetical protein P3TCK_11364 [Photobacterium profundum 3TCK]PSV62002.1 hypothetical protein C9J48_13545 [Photobacterium profundum]